MAMNNRSHGGLGGTYSKLKQNMFFSEGTSRAHAAIAYCFDTLWDSSFKIVSV